MGSGKIAAVSTLLAASMTSIAVAAIRARSRSNLFPNRGIKGLKSIEGALALIALGTWLAAWSLIPYDSPFLWLVLPGILIVNAITLVGELRRRRREAPPLVLGSPPMPPESPDTPRTGGHA